MKSQPLDRDPVYSGTDICSSCAAPLSGRYCAQCGERRVERHEQTIRHFLRESLAETVSLDGKLLRTLRGLVFRPGHLTREYMDGRRVLYLRPLQLFLLANLVYFVVQPYTGYAGYNTGLASQMDYQIYSNLAGIPDIVARDAAQRGLTMEAYITRYDAKSAIYAKSLILLMVPLFAAMVGLLHIGRRKPAVQHLVFATHYFAWELLLISSLFLFIYGRWIYAHLAQALIGAGMTRDGPAGSVLWMVVGEMPTVILIVPYLLFAFRRAYADSWGGATFRALLCVPLLLVTMAVYRYMLFWVTFATL